MTPSTESAPAHPPPAADACPGLTVLILHWNNPLALRATLQTLARHIAPHERFVVLDNASASAHQPLLRQVCAEAGARLIEAPENRGWGGAINDFVASRDWTDDEVLAISAHDALVRRFSWPAVARALADRHVVFISPQYPEPLHFGFSLLRSFRPVAPPARPCGWVQVGHATLCFARPAVLRDLRYDEEFFIYGCESEIFLRTADHGYRTWLTDEVIVENPGTDTSSDFRHLAFTLNSVYASWLRGGLWGHCARAAVCALSALHALLRGRSGEFRAKARALAFCLPRPGRGYRSYRARHGVPP